MHIKTNSIAGRVIAHHNRDATANAAAELICPHCQAKGIVSSKSVKAKKGISGGKATGAVLTLGISTLATGLSPKQLVTVRTCSNCQTTWEV
jgi:hypothetical protein